jgi:PHD/YefM family antitoxin component YafN of YafNO toxin-antitoxin module
LKGVIIPTIIPIKDLKDTTRISQLVYETDEPVFVTKNGYGEMVIMSMDTYEKNLLLSEVLNKLAEAEKDFEWGHTSDAVESIARIKEQHGI